jgi:mRNA-degrading endonuclease RelE of RelBE toxin-antitoxin system
VEFRIADTFTASLARLNGAEQKAVKTTAFDLQLNLSSPGLRFHRLDRPRDPNFWSVRVNDDIRLIVHRTPTSLLLCFVGHHDTAYIHGPSDGGSNDTRRRVQPNWSNCLRGSNTSPYRLLP